MTRKILLVSLLFLFLTTYVVIAQSASSNGVTVSTYRSYDWIGLRVVNSNNYNVIVDFIVFYTDGTRDPFNDFYVGHGINNTQVTGFLLKQISRISIINVRRSQY
ncbi:MAG: hypothetical protein FWD13_07735 [Treponema sp.]|nr:hypothetical protein [Treponema sp.]